MKKANYIISAITIALGVAFLIYGRQFAKISLDGITSSASWPNILSWLLVAMGIILALYNTFSKKIPASKISYNSYEFHCLLIVMAIVIILLLVWHFFGSIISLAVFLPVLCYMLGERKWYIIVIYDAAVILAIWIVFEKILNSPLAKPFFM